jgi:hypothetical protein
LEEQDFLKAPVGVIIEILVLHRAALAGAEVIKDAVLVARH